MLLAQVNTIYGSEEFLVYYLILSFCVAWYGTSWYKSYLIRHDRPNKQKELRFLAGFFGVLVVLSLIYWVSQGG